MKKNILLLSGGGGAEHEVSLVTADFIETQLNTEKFTPVKVVLEKDLSWKYQGKNVQLTWQKKLVGDGVEIDIHAVIPWIHGYPAETGHVTAFFDLIGLPYLGCETEGHMISFNKVLTKLWCAKLGIDCTEFDVITSMDELPKAQTFFNNYGSAFLKASNQGSSVGCYPVRREEELEPRLRDAFGYSNFVVIERLVDVRELEISVFDYQGKTHATKPCEIICPDKFYSYDEKYSKGSHTTVNLVADLSEDIMERIRSMALSAYKGMKLRHLSRMDFFIEGKDRILLNEINTYPGMTPISMFPKMMENYGVKLTDFLDFHLNKLVV